MKLESSTNKPDSGATRAQRGQRSLRDLRRRVAAELEHGRDEQAVRHFLQAASGDGPAATGGQTRKLLAALGEDVAKRLVSAFAEHNCFYCDDGRQSCDACGGSGRSSLSPVCEACVGLGSVRCDFCGGSSKVSTACVPDMLRWAVIAKRAKAAAKRSEMLLERRLHRSSQADPKRFRAECREHLLALEQQVSALEQIIMAARQQSGSSSDQASREKIVRACRAAAKKCTTRVRECLKALADSYHDEASDTTRTPEDREKARVRHGYYAQVVESGIPSGSTLEHPFLEDTS